MILPIVSYGNSILKKKCKNIEEEYPDLKKLIDNMWETLYSASGCGLAAPQINHSIKLFIVDTKTTYDNMKDDEREEYFSGDTGIVKEFINAKIIERSMKTHVEKEGCLSIPSLNEKVERPWSIIIEYYDVNFRKKKKVFSGYTARAIQHEYDHTEGILYIDHLKPARQKALGEKLQNISVGDVEVDYKMKFKK
jgi:peptide deformylase